MPVRWIASITVSLLMGALVLGAQNAPTQVKPISQSGLTEALRIGGLTTQELVDIVQQRGVAFPLTAQVEAELRAAGAETALVDAVRATYRPPANKLPLNLEALSKNEIATLLDAGMPSARIQQIVNQRGVSFAMTDAIRRELSDGGADTALLAAIEARASTPPPASPTERSTQPAAANEQPVAKPVPPPKRLSSLKEVHKLFVEDMSNKLDDYLRAEITRQLPGRIVLVTTKEDADANLLGTGEEQTGAGAAFTGRTLGLHDTAKGAVSIVDKAGTVLWASEAGDRTLLFGALKRGGPREVATRLIQDLKKAMDAVD